MTRPNLPAAVPSANVHRIFLHDSDRDDFERLEDLVADGLGALRGAIAAMRDLPGALALALDAAERGLRQEAEKRRLLSATCRTAIERWLDEAGRRAGPLAGDPVLARISHGLSEALAISDRALDLIAAERDIGWHRNRTP